MENSLNSAGRYISAKPAFALQAANDMHVPMSVFTREELCAVREAIYPHGGTFYLSDLTFNGQPQSGQRLDIHTPLQGSRTDSHILSLYKVPVTDTEHSYAVRHTQTNYVLPTNKFTPSLNMALTILQNGQSDRNPNHSYNG